MHMHGQSGVHRKGREAQPYSKDMQPSGRLQIDNQNLPTIVYTAGLPLLAASREGEHPNT